MNSFFKDLKIVELANVLAGPAVGLFFAELGALVVKVENKLTNGDVTRSWKIPSEDTNAPSSAYFASVNWNKTSIFVDLHETADRQQVMDLIKDADIVISNYKPGDDVKLQMDYQTLKKINPRLIYGYVSGFGNNSPRTAYDLILQAETGFMYMNGTPESGPLKMPVALIDVLAAHQLKEGILIALIKRMQTGKGSCVTASLEHAAVASLANQASNWLMTGYDHQPSGSLHPNIAPYGELFTTADSKKIVLAIGNDKQFKKLCEVLNRMDIAEDPRFVDNTLRVLHRKILFEGLQSTIVKENAAILISELIKHNVPAGIIKSVREVFDNNAFSRLILEENKNNYRSKRVKTAIFEIFD
jgi:crotonobetainyl-CoA:carnitine CoA-transferase CaiB-like acyl-CoA transferase